MDFAVCFTSSTFVANRPMFLPAVTQQLDEACSRVAAGRAAARELDDLVRSFGLKEVEFRLLWCLMYGGKPVDQRSLAGQLGCSTAQISGLVEAQRSQGNIAGQTDPDDRRRQLWQLTLAGRALLGKVVSAKTTNAPSLTLRRDAA